MKVPKRFIKNYTLVNKRIFNLIKGDNWPTWKQFIYNDFSSISQDVVNEVNDLKLDQDFDLL